MLLECFFDEQLDIDLDIKLSLDNVNAIIQVKIALPLDGDGQFLVNVVHNNVGSARIRRGNSKIVNLLHKEDTFAVERSGI